ncbi:hypothetical protein N5079_20785 [Planotetraspora sp. A-T 1434]|uniref:hypothetical protein n=1 Tax=Planotetraspora sp. A-T 1434 TaxID=2979219 RepID=UPI0021BE08E5|nr:hypothetical protein [Planotetraspora sp. A-T 1434]MCT9932641.1 hypothetical protein [Planotetraspora sp. A-T 1434]
MSGSTIRNAILAAVILTVGVGRVAAAPPVSGGDGGKAFTACMRSQGLPGFPDVTVSTDGLINLDIKGDRVDTLSHEYGAAVKACESLLPADARLRGAPAAPSALSLPS